MPSSCVQIGAMEGKLIEAYYTEIFEKCHGIIFSGTNVRNFPNWKKNLI